MWRCWSGHCGTSVSCSTQCSRMFGRKHDSTLSISSGRVVFALTWARSADMEIPRRTPYQHRNSNLMHQIWGYADEVTWWYLVHACHLYHTHSNHLPAFLKRPIPSIQSPICAASPGIKQLVRSVLFLGKLEHVFPSNTCSHPLLPSLLATNISSPWLGRPRLVHPN